jgi:hypothetical protein
LSRPNLDPGKPLLFGWSVALLGNRLVVGAPWNKSASSDPTHTPLLFSGAAYIFDQLAGGTWEETQYVTAPQPGESDVFGHSVAIAPGIIAIGAPQQSRVAGGPDAPIDNGGASYSGAAYVFRVPEL